MMIGKCPVVIVLLTCFGTYIAALPDTLSQQCWHDFPFTNVYLQSKINGLDERVMPLEIHGALFPLPRLLPSHAETNHGPWTHPPVCTGVLSTIGSRLCVYTNAMFSDGRGISIITTPKVAEELAALPAFQDSSVLLLDAINTFSGAWYTQQLPGKGIGMMAKKHLGFKDRVTAYTPAIIAYLESELGTLEREKLFRVAIDQLPDITQDKYMNLSTVYGHPEIKVQDIVKANTFQLHVGGHNHLAVFPETSRLNHACAPNAQYHLDPVRLTHFVHATRPILQGEEITISYTSPLEPTEARQRYLQSAFHFTCSCPRCNSPENTDATIAKIHDMQNALNDWTSSSTGSPELAEQLLDEYRKERLEGFLDIPYGFAALAYNGIGEITQAVKYANLAQDAILLKDGSWTPNMRIWEELLKDPKAHWSFQRRNP